MKQLNQQDLVKISGGDGAPGRPITNDPLYREGYTYSIIRGQVIYSPVAHR